MTHGTSRRLPTSDRVWTRRDPTGCGLGDAAQDVRRGVDSAEDEREQGEGRCSAARLDVRHQPGGAQATPSPPGVGDDAGGSDDTGRIASEQRRLRQMGHAVEPEACENRLKGRRPPTRGCATCRCAPDKHAHEPDRHRRLRAIDPEPIPHLVRDVREPFGGSSHEVGIEARHGEEFLHVVHDEGREQPPGDHRHHRRRDPIAWRCPPHLHRPSVASGPRRRQSPPSAQG